MIVLHRFVFGLALHCVQVNVLLEYGRKSECCSCGRRHHHLHHHHHHHL